LDELSESISELVDYIHRKLINLINKTMKNKEIKYEMLKVYKEGKEEWLDRYEDTEFSIELMCINIFRYITDNLKKSAMGLSYKIIEEYDFIEILCTLIDLKPYFRINTKDQKIVYTNNKWEILPKSEFNRVNKTEAQLWLSILNLFANEDIRKN